MRNLFFFICTLFLSALGQAHDPVSLRLLPSYTATNFEKSLSVGLEMHIEEGWTVYAPSPNDFSDGEGFPPELSWEASKNVAEVTPHWLPPEKKVVDGKEIFVYSKNKLIPLTLTLKDKGAPLNLSLRVRLLACSHLCRPVDQILSLSLPAGFGQQTGEGDLLTKTAEEIEEYEEGTSLITLLGLAFLGGVILNFMPCVLPVLSIKVLSFSKTHERKSLLYTAFGIFLSFMCIATGAVILKASGESVGWGIHFQNPLFLSFMILFIGLFAANLWGLFDFYTPAWASKLGSLSPHSAFLGDIFHGFMGTLLATPCCAPFLGTALGFAFTHDTSDIYLVFTVLSLGFSLPYFLLFFFPGALPLPKPGPWMGTLQRVLGTVLLGTVGWFVFLLSHHQSLWLTLGTLLCLALLVLALRRVHKPLLLGALFMGGVTFPLLEPLMVEAYAPVIADEKWVPFDERAIARHVSEGKVVFVDVTAQWCLTCIANKRLVFDHGSVVDQLKDVVLMRADWTRHDEKILAYLSRYGRHGIPFNIIYSPKYPQGLPLPELLTPAILEQAFKKAKP